MDNPRKNQVSLRGASAKEISRDALLEKVSHERELRNHARRAAAATMFIQRVWKQYIVTRKAALELREGWEAMVNDQKDLVTAAWISNSVLRPFLFFIECLLRRPGFGKTGARDVECTRKCFKILLESINSCDSGKNFCSMAFGTHEERRIWTYQARKLITLCSFIVAESDSSHVLDQEIVALTSLAIRLLVILTDVNGWKITSLGEADVPVKDLVRFMGTPKSGLYASISRYIKKLNISFSQQRNILPQSDDRFLIAASAVTLALLPFHATNFDLASSHLPDKNSAVVQYCKFLLTIPWFTQRLPAIILPALKHKSTLIPCFQTLLVRL